MDHADATCRASNLTWAPTDLNDCFEGIPISKSVQSGRLAASSTQTIAVATDASRGGNVAFIPINRPGPYSPEQIPSLQCHGSAVTDLMWSPIASNLLATASWDRTVRVWSSVSRDKLIMPNSSPTSSSSPSSSSSSFEGMEKKPYTSQAPAVKLAELIHIDRVVCVAWSPSSPELIASAIHNRRAMIWDISLGGCAEAVQAVRSPLQLINLSASVCDFSWSPESHNTLLASACRDKRLYMHDLRSPSSARSVVSWVCHRSSKPWKISFLDERTIASVGFGEEGGREVAIWNLTKTTAPVQRFQCDQSSGGIILHYYLESRYLFLSGRGDNSLRIFTYSNHTISLIDRFQSPHPYRDICWMPQPGLNSAEGEIARCFRLFVPDSALVLAASGRRSDFSSTNQWAEPGSSVSPTGQGPPSRGGGRGVHRHTNSTLIEPLSVYRCDLLHDPCTNSGPTGMYHAQTDGISSASKDFQSSFKKICPPGGTNDRQDRELTERPPAFPAKVAPAVTSSTDSTSTLTLKSDYGRPSPPQNGFRPQQQPRLQKTNRRQRICLTSGSATPYEAKAPFRDSRRRNPTPHKKSTEVNTISCKIKRSTQTHISNRTNAVERRDGERVLEPCTPVRLPVIKEREYNLNQKPPTGGRKNEWNIKLWNTADTSRGQESKPCPLPMGLKVPSRSTYFQRRRSRRGITVEALSYPKDQQDTTDVGDSVWESEEAGTPKRTSAKFKSTTGTMSGADRKRWMVPTQPNCSFGDEYSAEQSGTSPRLRLKHSQRDELDDIAETCSVSDLVAVFEAKLAYQDALNVSSLENRRPTTRGRNALTSAEMSPLLPTPSTTNGIRTHVHASESPTRDRIGRTQPPCARRYRVQRPEQPSVSLCCLSPALRYMQRASATGCNLISPVRSGVPEDNTRTLESGPLARDKRMKTLSRRHVLVRRSRKQSIVRKSRRWPTEGQLRLRHSDVTLREEVNEPSRLYSVRKAYEARCLDGEKLSQPKMTFSEKLEVTPFLPLLTVSALITPPASIVSARQDNGGCRSENALTPNTLQRIFRSTREFYYKYTPSPARLTRSLETSDAEDQVGPSRQPRIILSDAESVSTISQNAARAGVDRLTEAASVNENCELVLEDHGKSINPVNKANPFNEEVQSRNLVSDLDAILPQHVLTS